MFAQGDKYFTPARWCQAQTFPGAAHERAELGREQRGLSNVRGWVTPKTAERFVLFACYGLKKKLGFGRSQNSFIKNGFPENLVCSP